jgi:hypothetical protein
MIRPFQEQHLNAASYDLTLGPRCVLDGQELVLDPKRRILRIPPSTIALVTSREVLLMPHWLVATFNLKSKFIFDGLLMGAGPQIDPGYKGVLTCPLHNISSKTIEIELCKPFAKLDFVKTTWDGRVELGTVLSEEDLYAQGDSGLLLTDDAERVRLWPEQKNFPPPVSHLAGSEGAKSSLRKLETSFEELREEFEAVSKTVRIGEIAGVVIAVALITAIIGLAAVLIDYTDGKVESAGRQALSNGQHPAHSQLIKGSEGERPASP